MALSTAELQRCRFWLGYHNLLASARPYFDIALIFEDIVLQNLDTAWGEGYVRGTILPNLDAVDSAIQAQVLLQVQAAELVGDIKLDAAAAFRSLRNLSEYWKDQLSQVLGVERADRGTTSTITLT
jgi:hypothetical protein